MILKEFVVPVSKVSKVALPSGSKVVGMFVDNRGPVLVIQLGSLEVVGSQQFKVLVIPSGVVLPEGDWSYVSPFRVESLIDPQKPPSPENVVARHMHVLVEEIKVVVG